MSGFGVPSTNSDAVSVGTLDLSLRRGSAGRALPGGSIGRQDLQGFEIRDQIRHVGIA
jgi:hypothetical protein